MTLKNQFNDIIDDKLQDKNTYRESLNDLFDKSSTLPYGTKDRIFPFSNELLNLYMPFFSYENQKILANLGSGDFALNAYFLGAKHVDTFDINEYSYYYYELKKTLIKYYDYEQFLNIIENPKIIYNDFNQYKHLLKPEVKNFITNIFDKYQEFLIDFAKKIFLSKKFNSKDKNISKKDLLNLKMTAQFRNFYLKNKENYNIIRNSLINNIDIDSHFFKGDVMKLNFSDTYDLIYLSNIGDVIDPNQYFNFLNFLRYNFLNDKGKIIIVDKVDRFNFLLKYDYISKVDYDLFQISNYNTVNKGISNISNLELIVNIYTINK